MSLLPPELIDEIIDIVAERSPESLTDCALVSRSWTPRSTHHIGRIFRTPIVSTFDALHAFLAIVQKHPRLATLSTSLTVVPAPGLTSASGSYVPFHHLASHVLPNLRHLILKETLRWSDYPLLYHHGTVGFSFHSVVALDISCHFSSIWDLFSIIQSFRNIQDVRLIYPHHTPPPWMFPDQIPNIPPRRKRFSRETFKLQNLEVPLAIGTPVLGALGESVVNISVLCPEMSTVLSREVSQDLTSSWALLQTVKITVPLDKGDSMLYYPDRLVGKLHYLLPLTSITKPDVRYSLFLVICREHNAGGYCLEDISNTELHQIILTGERMGQFERCPHCPSPMIASISLPPTPSGTPPTPPRSAPEAPLPGSPRTRSSGSWGTPSHEPNEKKGSRLGLSPHLAQFTLKWDIRDARFESLPYQQWFQEQAFSPGRKTCTMVVREDPDTEPWIVAVPVPHRADGRTLTVADVVAAFDKWLWEKVGGDAFNGHPRLAAIMTERLYRLYGAQDAVGQTFRNVDRVLADDRSYFLGLDEEVVEKINTSMLFVRMGFAPLV